MSPLVVFGEDWGGLPSSTQHLVRRLATSRDVVWVNSLGLRRPRINRSDLSRVISKLRAVPTGRKPAPGAMQQEALPQRLSIIQPISISWPGSALAQVFNGWSLSRQIRAELAARGLSRPILWTSLPSALPVIGTLGEHSVVYYCGDDFSSLHGVDHGPVEAMEREVVRHADLVLAASETLAARFPSGKTALMPHGVDLDLFRAASSSPKDMPRGGKIAGFYGSLAGWIDTELLAATAHRLPDWTFVLIGPVKTDVSMLAALPNVRLMGPRRHSELAGYARRWDVSLLPFRDCEQIRACNPLKLREYLAAGPPIATTNFPALDGYRDLVHVGAGPEGFARAILDAGQDVRSDERRAAVAHESWDARAADVENLLVSLDAGGMKRGWHAA